MDNNIHSRLITTLLKVPGMDDYTVRTSLILNIQGYQQLARHNQDARADVIYIVNGLAEMRFSDGTWALLIFIDNALARVPHGTSLKAQLQELRQLLEDGQSADEHSGEAPVEPEKKEKPPDNDHQEIEEKEGQTGEAHSHLFEQIQIYHSNVEDVLNLLVNAEESLNKVCMLFKDGKGIMQDQCNKAISHINNLRTALSKAHALYDKAPYFQGAFPLLSFQIKVMLNDTDDQIDKLTSNLYMFRDGCPILFVVVQTHQSENEREKIENDRKKISEQLGSLLGSLKEINMTLHNYFQSLPTA
jgi:hypothetical protein